MCQRLITKPSHEYRAPYSLHISHYHINTDPFIVMNIDHLLPFTYLTTISIKTHLLKSLHCCASLRGVIKITRNTKRHTNK